MKNRNKISYFEKTDGAPAPVTVEITRRARFSEVDAMGIVWNGRYPGYFEEAASELGRIVGLSYGDYYTASLRAPIVKLHVDYFKPIFLDEEFTIRGSLIWHEGSRLNTEFVIIKKGGSIAAGGYTVQMLIDAESWEVCIVPPALLEAVHERWRRGEFSCRS